MDFRPASAIFAPALTGNQHSSAIDGREELL
jgi:hypothetical protein